MREENSAAVRSNNYPSVLTKFKVSNKVKNRHERDDETKNKTGKAHKENVQNKMSQPNKLEDKEIDDVEEDLKGVMGDMGLIEKQNDNSEVQGEKTNIYDEDQNFEDGLNKIDSMKVSYFKRRERASFPDKERIDKGGTHCKGSKCVQITNNNNNNNNEKKTCSKEARARGECKRGAKTNEKHTDKGKHIANYQYEGEAYLRNKRQEKENLEMLKSENDEIVKDLEASGELTVSGNKSPLATKNEDMLRSNEQDRKVKEDAEYEKRLERNIQTKINAIKNEVRREIRQVKANSGQRTKRQVENTLLDGETGDLDPSSDNDQELEPYVRKRRDVEESDSDSLEDVGKDKRETDSDLIHDDMNEIDNVNEASLNKSRARRDEKSDDVSDANLKLAQADQTEDVVKRDELIDNNDIKETGHQEQSEDAQAKNTIKSKRDLKNEADVKDDESTISKNGVNDNYLEKRNTNLEETDMVQAANESKSVFKRSNVVDVNTNADVKDDNALSKREHASEDITKPVAEYEEKNQLRQTREAEINEAGEKNEKEVDVNKREQSENEKTANKKAAENSTPVKRSCEADVELQGKKMNGSNIDENTNFLGQQAVVGETSSKIREEDENMERSKRGIDSKSDENFDIDKTHNPHKRMDNFEDNEPIGKKLNSNKITDYEVSLLNIHKNI